jgi:hypothetical protein
LDFSVDLNMMLLRLALLSCFMCVRSVRCSSAWAAIGVWRGKRWFTFMMLTPYACRLPATPKWWLVPPVGDAARVEGTYEGMHAAGAVFLA